MPLPPGICTPEEAAAAIEADGAAAAAGYDALKRSVATLGAQVALLMNIALANGDTSINAIRATLGLPGIDLRGDGAGDREGPASEPAPARYRMMLPEPVPADAVALTDAGGQIVGFEWGTMPRSPQDGR